jgi:hypothetical protein
MARRRAFDDEIDQILDDIQERGVRGCRNAAEWLADQLRDDVSLICPAYSNMAGEKAGFGEARLGQNHSPIGGPPYMETGEGRDSIFVEETEDGAEVALHTTDNFRGPGFQNQLAYWDAHGRPWFKGDSGGLWKRKYGRTIGNIIAIEVNR